MTLEGALVLVTCAELPGLHGDDAPLLDALAERGIVPRILAWDDPSVDWGAPALVAIRSTWDYVPRREEFIAWAARVGSVTQLWNPAEVIARNTDKRYLRDLAAAGVPVVPTHWAERGAALDLAELLAQRGWDRAVVKPAVSAGSIGTIRIDTAGAAAAQGHLEELLAAGAAMVQPYLDSIETEGEVSILWIDGEITHAVRKRPRAGDFRVQETFGGTDEPIAVDAELRAIADATLAHAGPGCRYARVDVARGADGRYELMELELVEPQLFLRHCPHAAARYADALTAAVRAPELP